MPIVVQLLLALAAGGALVGAWMLRRARRAHEQWVHEVIARVAPVVERRAAALAIPLRAGPEVGVGNDGELEMDDTDGMERLLRLVDAVDAREHAQLGYLDTMRVSKHEVDANVIDRTGQRAKG